MADGPKKVIVAGLVGGIAAGKSFAANTLVGLGAEKIDADDIGHQVLLKPLVIRTLAQQFGQGILNDQGKIDREALAAVVFGSDTIAAKRRQELESIVHPLIHAEAIQRLRALKERDPDPPPLVVVDAPLLLEADWRPMCNVILFVDTPEAIRRARSRERGWTDTQFEQRESSQMPVEEKRAYATHIVSGQDEQTMRTQLLEFWNELTK